MTDWIGPAIVGLVVGGLVWFVLWVIEDCRADVRWWKEHQ